MFESLWTNDMVISKDSRNYDGKEKWILKKNPVIKIVSDVRCSQPYDSPFSSSLIIAPIRITSRVWQQIYGVIQLRELMWLKSHKAKMGKEGYLLQKGFGCAQQTGVLVQLGAQEEGG